MMCLTVTCLHMNQLAYMGCNFNCHIETEGYL